MAAVLTADYIKAKLSSFGIEMSDIEFDVLLLNNGIAADTVYTPDQMPVVNKALYYAIPVLLLLPDVTQGDASRKWDRSAIKDYYTILADELGLPDTLTDQPTIKDKSYIW